MKPRLENTKQQDIHAVLDVLMFAAYVYQRNSGITQEQAAKLFADAARLERLYRWESSQR